MRLAIALMNTGFSAFGIDPTVETVYTTHKADALTEEVYKEIVATFKRPVISITRLEEVEK